MWWTDAIFYEIYIRSFQDNNADGVGDLNGIASRLDYLAGLGAGAIWITPFYPSPQVDFGYDVSNYEDVDPQFGTLADFDRLVAAAHARGLRIVVDLVLNHTSDQHPWFEESRSSVSSPRRDWYVWRDGTGPGRPPSNWESVFGGPAWTFDDHTGQWYYHCFYSAQPDLNWRNPLVEERMCAVMQFWIDRGVDGFRLDAVNALFEDLELRDNPTLAQPKITLTGIRTQEFLHTRRMPQVHDVLRRLRRFVESRAPHVVLISEAYVEDVEDLVEYYGDRDNEMHLPFNFFLAQVPALDATLFKRAVDEVQRACGARWPSLVFSNHDVDRACDRYAVDADADDVAKLLAALLLTLRGSPFVYYGEEIGMRTVPPTRIEDVRDPVGRTFWPRYRGRDGVRRPMAWDASAGAGFSQAAPWLALPSDAAWRNVAAETREPQSILSFYRALARLRAREALRSGDYRSLASDRDVFAFLRYSVGDVVLVILNMAADARAADLSAADTPSAGSWTVALGTRRAPGTSVDVSQLRLDRYEVIVLSRSGSNRTSV